MQQYIKVRFDGPNTMPEYISLSKSYDRIWDIELVTVPTPQEAFEANGFSRIQAQTLVNHIDDLIGKGNIYNGDKISAIKVVRMFTNPDDIGLKEAKQIIDAYMDQL
jgi:ribosomal protein L7/L12